MENGIKTLVMIALGCLSWTRNDAATVTVDFDDALPQFQHHNFESNGFRFSPCSDFAITSWNPIYPDVPPSREWSGYQGSQFFSFQNAGTNSEYLGDALDNCAIPSAKSGLLYIDNGGNPFALESLYGPLVNSHIRITSSKGGDVTIDAVRLSSEFPPDDPACVGATYWCPQMHSFSGPEWVGIQWLKFEAGQDIFTGFDQITFRAGVPEPGTLALFGLGLAGLGLTRRRKAH